MFGDSLMTALTLLVVVFSVLILLSVIIWLFGHLINTKPKAAPKEKATPPKPVAVSVTPPPTRYAADDEDEIAAVIAAAVAMMAPAGMVYRVKKILPAGQKGRSEWASAAIRQNTMPF